MNSETSATHNLLPSHKTMSNITNNKNNNNMRSVRFSSEPEVVCYVTARSELTTEEMNETWWSPLAMKEFFRSAKTLSKDAQRSNFMVTGFEQAYDTSATLSHNGKAVLHATLKNISVHQDVLDWCRFGHSWRGLERSSSVVHNEVRTHTTDKAKNVVLNMMMMKRETVDPQVLRRVYERASRSSKIFARIMGEADAMVSIPSVVQVNQQQSSTAVKKQQKSSESSTTSSFSSRQRRTSWPAPLMLRLAL